MNDKEFLQWIHDRLEFHYGDKHNYDFMYKLRAIIRDYPEDKVTSNIGE